MGDRWWASTAFAVAALAAVAACSGSGSGSSSSSGASSNPAGTPAGPPASDTVKTTKISVTVLTNVKGFALYSFGLDTATTSMGNGQCAKFWPPLPVNDFPFPDRYKYLAVAAYERGEIGDSDLAHYLRCDVVEAREIAEATLASREVESTGEENTWRLDFAKSLLNETP